MLLLKVGCIELKRLIKKTLLEGELREGRKQKEGEEGGMGYEVEHKKTWIPSHDTGIFLRSKSDFSFGARNFDL